MASESNGVEMPIVDSLSHVNTWLSDNSDLLIQYGVNIISALLILFIGNIIVKAVAGSVSKVLKKKTWIQRWSRLFMVWFATYCL